MFAKIRTAKHLKVKAITDQIEVGFFGWVARVAQVHQFGQHDRVSKKGVVQIPQTTAAGTERGGSHADT
ncbi:phage virion morphogenesis protein [Janthinobacterium rivuli]|uniref:phage virion morphogenesis protein n=1 Tax=Janthinobacterium rivuli TaxID=2751478 RepID=UPI00383B8699